MEINSQSDSLIIPSLKEALHISCSIVCYKNTPQQITQVLDGVLSSSYGNLSKISVCLVDNSPGNELSSVACQFGVDYLHLPHNPGFGAAHNIAIKRAIESSSTYHLVLNPDTYFEGDVIPALAEYMEANLDIGLVMPRIRYPDGRDQHLCKLLPRPGDLLLRRFWPKLYESSGQLSRYELHQSGYSQIMDVPSLSGCFMLIRTSVLKKIGLFDERFFMYLEDVDLCRRIGRIARTVYFPNVSIIHEYVKGSYKNWRLLYQHIRSAVLYFNKWGWLFDREREKINRDTLQKLELL